MSIVCWSCSGKPTNSENNIATAGTTADSATIEEPAKVEMLVTPDLTFLEVKGNVKEIKGKESDDYIYGGSARFDEDGNLTHYGNSDPIDKISNVKRDAQGHLTDFLASEWMTVTWREGKPSSKMEQYNEFSTTETYKYGDNGLMTEIEYRTQDEIEGIDNTEVAKIIYPEDAFDSKGNWIKRVVKYQNHTITEIREILYYQ